MPLIAGKQIDGCRSINFIPDALRDGRRLCTFNVIDDFRR